MAERYGELHKPVLIMSEYSLKERVQMLTSSLVYGGPMTFEQIKKLDWLKNTSEYGILFYLREAERYPDGDCGAGMQVPASDTGRPGHHQ